MFLGRGCFGGVRGPWCWRYVNTRFSMGQGLGSGFSVGSSVFRGVAGACPLGVGGIEVKVRGSSCIIISGLHQC